MYRLGMTEGIPIESRIISKRIENAQKAVEAQNFEARKHLLEYDDVMNKQRESIYSLRRSILEGREGKEYILNAAADIVEFLFDTHVPEDAREHPNVAELNAELFDFFGIDLKSAGVDLTTMLRDVAKQRLVEAVNKRYEEK